MDGWRRAQFFAVVLPAFALTACDDDDSSPTYSIGGTVTGLTGALVLQNNRTDDLTINADGTFAFARALVTDATYEVTVLTQPPGQTCSVSGGSGRVTSSNVTSIAVACTARTYTVGGTIAGLSGTVVLRNNGSDELTRSANGAFTFDTPVAHGGAYAVTVATHPAGQVCNIASGSGTITANVTSVAVTCVAASSTHTVGGTLTGLSGTVVLFNNSGDALTLNADGAFTFATPLPNGAVYDVTVSSHPSGQSCAVSSGTGVVRGVDVSSVDVRCADGGWTNAVRIDSHVTAGSSAVPQVKLDANGNAIAIWYQGDGSIWAARYLAATAVWEAPVNVQSPDSVLAAQPLAVANRPDIGVAANGNAIAVYRRTDVGTARSSIVAAHFTAASGTWAPAQPIEDDSGGSAAWPRVAVEPTGNALAVWNQADASAISNIVANRFTTGLGWGADTLVENEAGFIGAADQFPVVALSAALEGLVVFDHWRPAPSTLKDIFTANYGGNAWAAAQQRSNGITTAAEPNVAMNAAGDAFLVWSQSDGTRTNIIAKRRTLATGWELNEFLELDAASATEPQIAIAANGAALAVWTQNGSIVGNRYTPGSGWGVAAPIESMVLAATRPRLAMHPDGNAIAVWEQRDGFGGPIAAAYFSADLGVWGPTRLIGLNGPLTNLEPAIAMDAAGNAIAVWRQDVGGVFYIHANRYER